MRVRGKEFRIVDFHLLVSYDDARWTTEMITFQIAGYLTEFAGGNAEVKVDATPSTLGEALMELWTRHVGLRDRVLTERGEVRPHVNIFLNSQVVRRDQVMETKTAGNDEICIMPAVSGGSEARA